MIHNYRSMVRVEKNLYEKLFNIALLGRARKITSPAKAYYVQPSLYMIARDHDFLYHATFLQRYIDPILEKVLGVIWWSWARDLQLQKGLLPDDVHGFVDYELRRSVFLENVWRESCHPYQWLFYRYRRLRYYKIERTTQGFFVPEYVRKEAAKRTYADFMVQKNQWDNFIYLNFYSDLTPGTYYTRGKLNPLEFLSVYGLLRDDAWERYFLNEQKYDMPEEEVMNEPFIRPYNLDLDTEDGRRRFEDKVNTMVEQYPGMFVPEGQKYDFKLFYAW